MDQTKDFINIIGALAELTVLFRMTLVKNGVPEQEVQVYVCQFINTIFKTAAGQQNPES